MKRHEARSVLDELRHAWPALRLGRNGHRWELDLGLVDQADALAAIRLRLGRGAPAPASVGELLAELDPASVSTNADTTARSIQSPLPAVLEGSLLTQGDRTHGG